MNYGTLGNFDWFQLWVLMPFVIALIFATLYLKGALKSQVIPLSGAITSLFALPFYLAAYTYDGTDGQISLIFIVIPVYQYIGLIVFCIIGYITIFLRRAWNQKTK